MSTPTRNTTVLGMPTVPGRGNLNELHPFPEVAEHELGNVQMRTNLRKATGTIRGKRLQRVAEMPDWEDLRDTAEATKNDVIDRLPELLLQFEEAFTAAGGHVHWARDADEANAIVTGLIEENAPVNERGRRDVIKVKSMATQEIGLNEALEPAGIDAYETDLAELIVQLGGDKPSHILVPAIHRNREEIRQIFLNGMDDVDPDLAVFDLMMLAHAWALKHWHFGTGFDLDGYITAQLRLSLRSLVVADQLDDYLARI